MAAPNEFWLLTVPKEGQTPEATFEKLRRHTDGASQGYLIQVPSLTVGTLNSLMSLSEDMDKVDASIESVVRKVERQYAEVTPKNRDPLLVDAVPVDRYLPSFVWEHAKYPHRRALPELVQHLRQTVSETDDELKHLASTYADKTQKLQALKRSSGKGRGSLSLSPLEEVLSPEDVRKAKAIDTEYLVTVVVAVPKAKDQEFLKTYTEIAPDCISGESGETCSPAVPGSAVKLVTDGEASLYALTLLKGRHVSGAYEGDSWRPAGFDDFVPRYTTAARSLGFVVRPFAYDAEKVARTSADRATLEQECDRLHASIVRWCRSHFAESFVAWIHLKIVRAFVESVLRYGLPVDFLTVLLVPRKYKEQKLAEALDQMFAHRHTVGLVDDEEDDGYRPYVVQKCHALSAAA